MDFTELFYKDPYLTENETEVISCEPCKNGFGIVLKDTVFYPEGGGQPADRGVFILENGDVLDVKDVIRDRNDLVLHITDRMIPPKTGLRTKIDWDHRFSLMQNHTGEHIVSGLVRKRFGFENVGFHMGDVITIDLSGVISREDAVLLEREANKVIWKNLTVETVYPDASMLPSLDYRSKKELEGKVRLINIRDTDSCACCGLHVRQTGEIGLIKLLSLINYKGGVRIEMVCGDKALLDYEEKTDSVTAIKNLLSVKPHEVTDAVKKVLAESELKSEKIAGLNRKYAELKIQSLTPENDVILTLEEDLNMIELRKFCDALNKQDKAGLSVLLSPAGEDPEKQGFHYVIASGKYDLKEMAKPLNEALNGKGGGSKEMIQGTFYSSLEEIEETIRRIIP